jgi:organic radical activating enzyme
MKTPLSRTRAEAPVMEVFASVQGEGLYLGEPQVFLRLRGCPLRCQWCDTPGSWRLSGADSARIDLPDKSRGAQREPAWATPFRAACWIAAVEPGRPRTVSITGGEPLLWPDFIRGLREMAGRRRLHLETAGAHPQALESVLGAVDHVSLDLKLPADMGEPVEIEIDDPSPEREAVPRTASEWARVRAACLRLVRDRDACAKLVVAGGRRADDYQELLADLARVAPRVPLFVQPATAIGDVAAPERELVGAVVEEALELDLTVRVVPQVHRLLGVP